LQSLFNAREHGHATAAIYGSDMTPAGPEDPATKLCRTMLERPAGKMFATAATLWMRTIQRFDRFRATMRRRTA
jgi:hypothetical protein